MEPDISHSDTAVFTEAIFCIRELNYDKFCIVTFSCKKTFVLPYIQLAMNCHILH